MPNAGVRRHLLNTLVGGALIGALFMLPDLTRDARSGTGVIEAYRGRIESIRLPPADRDPDVPPVPMAVVRMLDGPRAGELIEAYLAGPGGSQSVADYRPGEEVVVTFSESPDRAGTFVAVSDRWRIPSLQVLGLLFAAAVVGVGGWHGVRALIALGLTIALILKILLPLVISGVSPVPLAVIGASGVTIVTIALTEGLKRSSLAAILGTTGALAITGLLAAAATAVMGFTYTAGSDLAFLTTSGGEGLDLRGVLLAAFILGAVGVLDDVTVTQAALVEELAVKGGLRGSSLVASAMGIGRSHIAATVNTLFLAYVGAGLPLLVVLLVSRQPGALVLNDETIATEVVRTVVGSLGIIAAVPLTTFVAASLVDQPNRAASGGDNPAFRRASGVLSVAVLVVVLLVAAAALPLTGGPRRALAPDVFDPGGLSSARPSEPTASDASTEPSPEEPTIVGKGEPVPITLDGLMVGTVTVTDWTVEPAEPPGVDTSVSVLVRYEARASFPLATGTWVLLLVDGTEVPLVPGTGSDHLERMLRPGEALELELEASHPPTDGTSFVIFVDAATSGFVFAVPID